MNTAARLISFSILLLGMLAGLAAERPSHLPQTVGLQFLQGLQLRDLDYARERVLPDQRVQFAVFQTMVEAAAFLPSVNERPQFELVSLRNDKALVWATFALPGRGNLALALGQVGAEWYVDLGASHFVQANGDVGPVGTRKVSQVRPLDRARGFLEAFIRLDLVQAASYGTETTRSTLMSLQAVLGLISARGADLELAEIRMMSEKIDGEQAVVEYRIGAKPAQPLSLVRQAGNWMVDLKPGQALP